MLISMMNADDISTIASIDFPNFEGTACQYTPNAITINHPGNHRNYINLPYFAAYHFNHKISDFSYSGSCAETPVEFFLENGYADVDSVKWNALELGISTKGDSVSFIFPQSGDWTVEAVVYQNGKTITSSQCVNICGKKSVQLPEYIDLCETIPFEVNLLSPCGLSYHWNTGDTTSALLIKDEGIYILEVATECGTFSDTMIVVRSENCTVLSEIPNIITPNEDDINDFFSIKYKNAVSFEYNIVNRWGNLLKQGNIQVAPANVLNWNTTVLWDGTTKIGTKLEDGVYFYRIIFKTIDGTSVDKSGFVHVVR
jgi:gliding motility-associated-like protein